ncbi:MAG: hypothetical protein MJ102_02460 [Clostridia bacterium]|nr:hypothetical protein [Clostridia bacterium]
MELKEKSAYLKGLADGLDFDKTTAEGKLIAALIDLVGELTEAIDDIDEDLQYLNDYAEELDEDLGEMEKFIYDDDCDCDCCCDDDDCYCDCDCCCDEDELDADEEAADEE